MDVFFTSYLSTIVCFHTAIFTMSRRARPYLGNRHRREEQRNYFRERRQVEAQAAQENHDIPVDAAVNELDELQLQHQAANDPLAMEAEYPILPEADGSIEVEPIELPAPHCFGSLNNRCPHCRARYFREECTTQGIFKKCCVQGKVSLPPIHPSCLLTSFYFPFGKLWSRREFLELMSQMSEFLGSICVLKVQVQNSGAEVLFGAC